MGKKANKFFWVFVVVFFLIFPAFIFAEAQPSEIEAILNEAMERDNRGNPDFNDVMLEKLVKAQPQTGNILLEKIKNVDDTYHRIAAEAYAKIWASLTTEQIEAYFPLAFDLYTELNDSYKVGDDAYIGMNYELSPYAIPKDANLVINTKSTHFLNGKQHGQPFKYSSAQARTGYIEIKTLPIGKHTFNWKTEYEILFGDERFTSIIESPEYSFEIIDSIQNDTNAIDPNKALDDLIANSLIFAQRCPSKYRNRSGEDTYGQYVPNGTMTYYQTKIGLHIPGYTLQTPLPIDLCYRVEIVLTQTGKILKPDNQIVVLAGEKVWWRHLDVEVEFQDTKEDPNVYTPIELVVGEDGQIEYLNSIVDPNGFIPITVILTTDGEIARISGIVDNYYNKKIVIDDLKIKIYQLDFEK